MNSNTVDLTGQRFGRWLVIRRAGLTNDRRQMWECACDCGVVRPVAAKSLLHGVSKSCGCLRTELAIANLPKGSQNEKHGMWKSRVYRIWSSMKQRCNNPNNDGWEWYGGRGIKVCDRWQHSFENFLADMGEPKEGESIDRIDSNGNYEPANCRWATPVEQTNNRYNTSRLTVDGVTKPLTEWASYYNIHRQTVRYRLSMGWDAKAALTTPIDLNMQRVQQQRNTYGNS